MFQSRSAVDGLSSESKAPRRVSAVVRIVVALVLCFTTMTAAVPTAEATNAHDPSIQFQPATGDSTTTDCGVEVESNETTPSIHRIVEVYPNPPTAGNVGEYFVVESPPNATGELTVSDGYATATIPADRPTGRVAVSIDPNVTATLTDYPIVELDGHLRLSVEGEELTLSSESEVVDTVRYDQAPEGEIWYRESGRTETNRSISRGAWWPQGATCRPVSTFDVDEATAFVLPDSPEVVTSFLAGADERIRLAGYTITDPDVRDVLLDALERGVAVDILVDREPVGGLPARTRPLLDDLAAAGATVRLLGGPGARYRFHHPKYAVADDRVLVTTENWKPSGVGGAASRGWGVIVADAELATILADVFDADATGHDAATWSDLRPRLDFVEAGAATGTFPETHDPERVAVDEVELLLAPDNAARRLEELIADADESIRIVQVGIGDPNFALIEAAIEAARRGVEVDVLLDGSWYVEAENDDLAERLEVAADREDLSLDVRVTRGGERFERIHAKGLVIDDDVAVVGSLNWNKNSATENREVVLVLHGEAAATYFTSVFEGDWTKPSGWTLPVTLALVVVAGAAGSILVGHRYLAFERPADRQTAEDARPVTIEHEDRDDT